MQWLEGLWTREGAGIDKDAPRPTGLALFFDVLKREWWEMVKLNILFLLASLPLITIPAATMAMAKISRAFAADENVYLLRDFLEAFRDYALRGTALILGCAGMSVASAYVVVTYAQGLHDTLAYALPLAVSLVTTTLIVLTAAYAIMLSVTSDMAFPTLLRKAAWLALVRPLPMLAALAFVAALWLAHILFYPVSVFMPATINFSLGMFAIGFAARESCLAGPDRGRGNGP